ncbi:MAG TPA: hypothetical protein PK341_16175 [Spirochaetota bacterium]|nr:hypothetical protein [Spirochaetota bacterium]
MFPFCLMHARRDSNQWFRGQRTPNHFDETQCIALGGVFGTAIGGI